MDDKYISVASPDVEHTYHYYQQPDGYRLYFRATADYFSREYIEDVCRDFGELYWTTKNVEYARRAALILLRFSEVYSGYAYKYDWPFKQKKFSPYTLNRIKDVPPYYTSRWARWAYYGVSQDLLRAYDCIRFWPGLKTTGDGRAVEKIEDDLFGAMVQFVMGFEDQYTNMSPVMWQDFIRAGQVLKNPSWILVAVERAEKYVDENFLYDGFWREPAPSYVSQVRGTLQKVMDTLADDKFTGSGSDIGILQSKIQKIKRVITRLEENYDRIRMPNGREIPVGDTWARNGSFLQKETRSTIVPGFGLSVLGGGSGNHQLYTWLNFSSGTGHKHRDALSIGMSAYGRELLSDIGYTHTRWRTWTSSTMSHNTVVVNGVEGGYDTDHSKQRIRVFASDTKGFHIVEAESDSAYPGVTDRFRRTLVLVGSDSRDSYLIDIFQVTGGNQHDYLLHGSPAEDSTAKVKGLSRERFSGSLMNPGTKFEYPKGESFNVGQAGAYGFVKDLTFASHVDKVQLEMRMDTSPQTGINTHLICPVDSTVYLGKAPRIRPAEKNDNLLDRYYAPFFCIRTTGQNLSSLYTAVHEPTNGSANVKEISSEPADNGVIVTIDRGVKGRDYFLMAFDGILTYEKDTQDGLLCFNGRWGLLRASGNKKTEGHIVAGTELSLGDSGVFPSIGWSGQVLKAVRQTNGKSQGYFEIDKKIDPKQAVTSITVEFGDKSVRAYNMTRLETFSEGSRIYVFEDPGFIVTSSGVELVTYPRRNIQSSTITYTIHGIGHIQDN